MADETSTTATADATETDATATGSEQVDDTATGDESGLPEGAKRALSAARKQARDAEKARRALQGEVEQFKQRDMTEQQKLEQRATEAEKAAATATRELNRIRAAQAAGLEITDADLITGDTEAEIKASANRLAERFGARTAVFDGGARATAGRPADMNDLIRRTRSSR